MSNKDPVWGHMTALETSAQPLFASILGIIETLSLIQLGNGKALWLYYLHLSSKPFSLLVSLHILLVHETINLILP